jgi:hypothetical protein
MSCICPVCGFPGLKYMPRGPSGGGSYEICFSCHFEFGVSDDDKGFTYETWRERWISNGMKWSAITVPQPPEWDPVEQLKRIDVFVGKHEEE